jgi:hypothetical protein
MAAPVAARSGWLYGPWTDLLLGCGLLYLALSVLAAARGSGFSASLPAYAAPLMILLVSMPHYGATLLRVYEHRADRRSHVIFSLWATLSILVAFGFGVRDAGFASLLATVYLTWSPWHYTGQNYGIAVMLLRRREALDSALEKRLLHAAFILSYVVAALVMHGPRASAVDPGGIDYSNSMVRFVSIGIDRGWLDIVVPTAAAAQLLAAGGWLVLALRGAGLRRLAPALLLVVTQSFWFTGPAIARQFDLGVGSEILDWNARGTFFVFIAGAHAAQYLWVTSYYARASQGWRSQWRYYAKIAAAGCAVWTLPAIVFAWSGGERVEYGAGLALLVASVINIHHFVLDGAIWKLRRGPVARILIRSERAGSAESAAEAGAERGALRRGVWCVAAAGCVAAGYIVVERDVWLQRAVAERDLAAAERSLDRLAALGHDDAGERDLLGRRLAVDGELARAADQLERSATLRPRAPVFENLYEVYVRQGDAAAIRRTADRLASTAPERAATADRWRRSADALERSQRRERQPAASVPR